MVWKVGQVSWDLAKSYQSFAADGDVSPQFITSDNSLKPKVIDKRYQANQSNIKSLWFSEGKDIKLLQYALSFTHVPTLG